MLPDYGALVRDMADMRVRQMESEAIIGALQRQVANLQSIIREPAVSNAIRRKRAAKLETGANYAAIRLLAGNLPPDTTVANASDAINDMLAGRRLVPDSARSAIERLHAEYGIGGPCERTVRRALC